MNYIRSGNFYMDLHSNPPRSMTELWLRAQKWIHKTEASAAKRLPEMEPEQRDKTKSLGNSGITMTERMNCLKPRIRTVTLLVSILILRNQEAPIQYTQNSHTTPSEILKECFLIGDP